MDALWNKNSSLYHLLTLVPAYFNQDINLYSKTEMFIVSKCEDKKRLVVSCICEQIFRKYLFYFSCVPWCLVGYNYFLCVKVLNLPGSLYLYATYWLVSPYFICQMTWLQACLHFILTSAKSLLSDHSRLDGCLTDNHVIACIWDKCAGCGSFNI